MKTLIVATTLVVTGGSVAHADPLTAVIISAVGLGNLGIVTTVATAVLNLAIGTSVTGHGAFGVRR